MLEPIPKINNGATLADSCFLHYLHFRHPWRSPTVLYFFFSQVAKASRKQENIFSSRQWKITRIVHSTLAIALAALRE
jgi:hypothetical protein